MQIDNIFQMNDWEINKFLKVIFAIQISVLGLVLMDGLGFCVPMLREIISTIYLLFVPGFLILRVLRLHKLSNIETLLYTVGLSISSLMFLGFFINMVYPLLGVSKPLSLQYLIITITGFVVLLSILSYFIDKDFADPSYIDFKSIISNTSLFLCFIPILSILGSLVFYFYNKNTIFMLMLTLVGLIVLLIGFKRFITPKYYPLAIFVISISLLFHTWLLSPYIVGRDIFYEVSMSNLVLISLHWNININTYNLFLSENTNAMLIISIFAPIVAKVTSISITNVYKVIFPLVISLTPLGLYKLFEKQTNKQIAFLAAFLFIIMGFYDVFLISGKQAMATFFIVLLFLCFLRKNNIKMAFLTILFMLSIVVSHYGTTYLFIFCLLVGGLIIWLIQNRKLNNLISKFKDIKSEQSHENRINRNLILLFITFSLAWYIYVSDSSVLTTILNIGDHILATVYDEFLSPQATEGLGLVLSDPTTLSGSLQKALTLLIQLFIVLGLLKVFFKDKMKFNLEFMAIALSAFLLDIFAVIIPNFSNIMYTPRLYAITLIFLAPFAVIGGVYFFDKINVLHSWKSGNSMKLLSIILITLFLLQVGYVKEVVNDPGTSISLSKEQMTNQMMNLSIQHKANFYEDYGIFEQNYYSINWLSNNMKNFTIYSDYTSSKALSSYNINLMLNWEQYYPQKTELSKFNYLYLSYSNVKGGLWFNSANSVTQNSKPLEIQEIQPIFANIGEIYSNGGSEIFYT